MKLKKLLFSLISISTLALFSCASNAKQVNTPSETIPESPEVSTTVEEVPAIETTTPETVIQEVTPTTESDTITLLFGGDIMAHTVNYQITTYEKIWRDVKYLIEPADLAFANIEAPIDTTRSASSYPSFNMTKKYVQAAIDAGFDVFSLSNNHTNDQYLGGIRETLKTTAKLTEEAAANGHNIYFSGTKSSPEAEFTYNVIEKNGWKIVFLPMTELLNRPDASSYVNYVKTDEASRKSFINYVKKVKAANPCDLFIISVHTAEPEYTRVITDKQENWYQDLLDAGADVVWANHAHIIKNRKVIVNTETGRDSLIMYANGNTISGQRTKPELTSKNPTGERDNTGDGLFYIVTLKKDDSGSLKLIKAEPTFITTYINTADEFVIKPLNQNFVDYLYSVPRTNWAKYIEKRIKINKDATKDLIEWR